MEEIEQAHHELERLQGIITRHEGHMFTVRGWLLTVVGGLLAAYYTNNIEISEALLWIALPLVTLLFLFVELRHVNLVEAVVKRAGELENRIATSRKLPSQASIGWYDGPKINEACQEGANRWWPRHGMTFVLNLPFYGAVILVIFLLLVSLPPRTTSGRPAPVEMHHLRNPLQVEQNTEGAGAWEQRRLTCRLPIQGRPDRPYHSEQFCHVIGADCGLWRTIVPGLGFDSYSAVSHPVVRAIERS